MSIANELAEILLEVSRPGDFFVSGRVELPAPRIEVAGVGPIALPLLPAQAKGLIKAASRAPYGRGAETIVDPKVRRTWQIGADRVQIGGKHWAKTLAGIVARVAEGLGVGEPVTAELYKLLIYDEGSFFVGHRDTEKASGMFATLVLALPSQSEGGELVVHHKEREARLDLTNDDPSEVAFAAFYADCVHEVLPVTTGCRATLVFNLVRTAKGKSPEPPSYEAEGEKIGALLDRWVKGAAPRSSREAAEDDDGWPLKLVYPLEHAYTPAELGFANLKGADAAIARLLTAVAPRAGVDLHLALLTIWESGSAQYTGRDNWHYRRGRRDAGEEDADEFEVVEVLDSGRTLSEWRRPDGAPAALTKLPIEDDEVAPLDALDDMEPDEEHFREATGNEGASFDRTYSRAALVLWPSSSILAVLNQAGLSATLPYLEDLAARWRADGGSPASLLKTEARTLAGHMLATWPERPWRAGYTAYQWRHSNLANLKGDESEDDNDDSSDIVAGRDNVGLARFIAVLTRLGETDMILAAVDKLVEQSGHDRPDNAAIVDAIALFPEARAADLLRAIVTAHAVDAPGACGALLRMAAEGQFAKRPGMLLEATAALVDALPGDPASAPKDQWGRPRVSKPDAALVVDLGTAVDRVDAALARRLAAHVLAWPQHFDPDTVLVPAMERLEVEKRTIGPAGETLHAAAITHLKARIALPLEAPRDWMRPSDVVCKCQYCRDLSSFLADPFREEWTLRAAQQHRNHVETEIKRARADVDMRTERKGSPHSLICRKNQASYERRVRQRKQDIANLAALTDSAPHKRTRHKN